MTLARFFAQLRRTLSVEQHLIGASLFRACLGGVVLYYFLGYWAQRYYLWGPNGVFPTWLFYRDLPIRRIPSLLAVDSEIAFDLLYLLGAVVALLYAIGWRTRWMVLPFCIFTVSLFHRNYFVLSGGENLVLVTLPFLLFMNTNAYVSLDSGWRRPGQIPPSGPRPFSALFHNLALFCIIAQLCIVYAVTAFQKIGGYAWFHGTALYYIMRVEAFTLPSISSLIYENPVLVTLGTYGTILFEISYSYLIWSQPTRWIAVTTAVLFHVAIAFFMGLVVFSAIMVIFQLIILDDDDYRSVVRWLSKRISRPAMPALSDG